MYLERGDGMSWDFGARMDMDGYVDVDFGNVMRFFEGGERGGEREISRS